MIKVGYKDYRVESIENLDDGAKLLYGRVFYDDGVIKVCNKYSIDQQRVTLLHEVIHAVDELHGIDLDEEQVVKLGKGLYQVLKDNPNIFEEISPVNLMTGEK
jgi:hypothetical protein